MTSVEPYGASGGRTTSVSPRVRRALEATQGRAIQRVANVQAEAIVQTEKIREIDNLAREAVTSYAMLRKWADTLGGADPLLADELRFFTDMARMGAGEIIADTVASYCRESRLS